MYTKTKILMHKLNILVKHIIKIYTNTFLVDNLKDKKLKECLNFER
jgi:hypothetical protein